MGVGYLTLFATSGGTGTGGTGTYTGMTVSQTVGSSAARRRCISRRRIG